jgi:hypothetical protein
MVSFHKVLLMNYNLLFDKDTLTQSTNAFSSKTEYIAVICSSATTHDLFVYPIPKINAATANKEVHDKIQKSNQISFK